MGKCNHMFYSFIKTKLILVAPPKKKRENYFNHLYGKPLYVWTRLETSESSFSCSNSLLLPTELRADSCGDLQSLRGVLAQEEGAVSAGLRPGRRGRALWTTVHTAWCCARGTFKTQGCDTQCSSLHKTLPDWLSPPPNSWQNSLLAFVK